MEMSEKSGSKKEGGWKRDKMIEVVFILKNDFEGDVAPKGKKYAIVIPVEVGVDSETHYAVKTGVSENDRIVTGSYKAISRELQHGLLVSIEENFGQNSMEN
jgi:hypothetical protein